MIPFGTIFCNINIPFTTFQILKHVSCSSWTNLLIRFLRRILQRLRNGGVEQMYTEMAFRHRVRFPCIQIIKTATNQLNFVRGRALSSSITPKSSSLWFSRKFDHTIGSSIPHIRHQGRTYLCNSC